MQETQAVELPRNLRCRRTTGGNDRGQVAIGGSMIWQQAIQLAKGNEPFAFLANEFRVFLRPGKSAVERPSNHGHVGFGCKRTHGRRRERRDAMNEVELASLQSPTESFADHVLEDYIAWPGHGRVDRPAKLVAATQHLCEKVDRTGDPLVINEMHVGKFTNVRGGHAFAVADVGDECDAKVGPCRECTSQVEANERNASPRRIAGLRDQKHSKRVGHAVPKALEAGGSSLYRSASRVSLARRGPRMLSTDFTDDTDENDQVFRLNLCHL